MATDIKTETQTDRPSPGLALSAKQLRIVRQLLVQNLPDHQAWAFGSRATGHARKYSDLDIAISPAQVHRPTPTSALPFHKLCQLSSAFEASDLDICVDIVDWLQASPEFRRSVEQTGMVRIR
jgi:type I restriction enzyme S subunit